MSYYTITGIVELMDGYPEPYIDITHRYNNYWNETLKNTKSVFEFDFEFDEDENCYNFVGCRKVTKSKANKNKL